VWRSPPFSLKATEIHLLLPRAVLPGKLYRLALYAQGEGAAAPLEVHMLEIEEVAATSGGK
jgi:hypothetical protein